MHYELPVILYWFEQHFGVGTSQSFEGSKLDSLEVFNIVALHSLN